MSRNPSFVLTPSVKGSFLHVWRTLTRFAYFIIPKRLGKDDETGIDDFDYVLQIVGEAIKHFIRRLEFSLNALRRASIGGFQP